MKYHLTPTSKAIIKRQKTASVGREVEKMERSYTAGGHVKYIIVHIKEAATSKNSSSNG